MKFSATAALRPMMIAALFLFTAITVRGDQQVVGRAEITPDLMYASWSHFIDPIGDGTIIVGDLQAGNLNAILPSTFRINGNIIPSNVTMLGSFPGFTGPVYQLTYPMLGFMEFYYPFYDSTLHDFTVTAVCQDNVNFIFPGQVMLRGHATGDVNTDGRVTITDLSLLVGFLFRNNSQLRDLQAADVNHNGNVTVSDVSALVRYLFVS